MMITRLAFLVLTVSYSAISAPQRAIDENFKLIILHNNDMHARFEQTGAYSDKCTQTDGENNKCYGGFARVAHEVREYRRRSDNLEIPRVLYLNAGDTYTGTPWFALYKDNITADFLNILKPDAISLGNHEFDEGTANLANFLKEIDFPVLAANLDLTDEPGLILPSLVPSKIFEIDGNKVGVIGYLTPETKDLASQNNVEYIDEVVAINNEAAKLKSEGVNIIIALGHSGLERDKQIAEQCPDIDLVIGGHSHTFLYSGQAPDVEAPQGSYPITVTQSGGRKVPVVQAYAYTKYLGYLHLEFDDIGELVEIDGTPILLNGSIPRDSDVLALLEVYRPGVLALEKEIVGHTKVFLDGSCRRKECNFGNFITDAMVDWYSRQSDYEGFWTDASIAFMQGGGIRASINHKSNAGNISKEDAATVMPFESKMEVIEISGTVLKAALEHSVYRYTDGEERGEFLQMSGVQVVYDMNRPSGERVVEAKVLCTDCLVPELQDIVEGKLYRIVIQDFLADGGDGFEMFIGTSIKKFETLDIDVLIEYLKRKSPIYPSVEWRITIKELVDPAEDFVGSTLVNLDKNCRQSECNLGNFITDAMVDWYALKYDDDNNWTDASIAIIQGSRIKAGIDIKNNEGKITKANIESIFSPAFFNLNIITLNGAELKSLFEHSVSAIDSVSNVEFLQVSGVQVAYDLNKLQGQRVTDIQVLCSKCTIPQLEPLVLDQEYKVIMQSILASGADGYAAVFGEKLTEDLNESDVNVFTDYLKKKSPIYPSVEWRITIKELVDPAEDVIGRTLVNLENKDCRQSECNLGNFITDSMVDWYALKYDENDYWTDASIAVIQGSRINNSFDRSNRNGEIVRAEALKLFDTSYNLTVVSFTGSELMALLEFSLSSYTNPSNVEFLQMSGLEVSFDMNEPAGQRVTSVKVLCAQCNVPALEALNPESVYKVIMQSVLAEGADGFDTLIQNKLIQNLGVTDANVFIDYLIKKSPVYPAVEWRITITDETTPPSTITTPSSTTTAPPTSIQPSDPTTQGASSLKVSALLVLLTSLLCSVLRR